MRGRGCSLMIQETTSSVRIVNKDTKSTDSCTQDKIDGVEGSDGNDVAVVVIMF